MELVFEFDASLSACTMKWEVEETGGGGGGGGGGLEDKIKKIKRIKSFFSPFHLHC